MDVLRTDTTPPLVAAEHFATKLALETDPADVDAVLRAGDAPFVVIDVRSRDAYREGHLPGAVSLPHGDITASSAATAMGAAAYAVVYCWGPHCNGATKGGLRLAELGHRVKELIGGIDGWRREGLPVATGDRP
jgi:rhodanese-related sulfurtransferase